MTSALIAGAVKVEVNPEPSYACRICLAWDVKLYDMHEWGMGDMYTEITGTTLSAWDGFPQYLCAFCRADLMKAHALRARSRRADALLQQALMHQHFITDSFVRTIDRSLHKLTHTLTVKSSENSGMYYCVYEDPSESKFECLIENNVPQKDTDNDMKDDDVKVFDLDCDDSVINDDYSNKICPDLNNSRNSVESKINLGEFDNKITNTDALEPNFEIALKKLKNETIKAKTTKARKRPATQKTEGKAKTKRNVNAKDQNVDTAKEKDTPKLIKRKPQKFTEKFTTEEEIKEFEKKYSVELKFLTEEEMVQEMEERKKSDSYLKAEHKCDLCYKVFLTSSSFNNHMKSHAAARGEHECHLCHWRYRCPGMLRDHARYVHKIRFHCTVCGKVILGLERVELHAAFHAGTHFKCNYCDKHFRRKTSCWTHMRIAHALENFESSCELCGEIFASKKGLKSHKTRSHREKVDKSLFCNKCRLQFDNKEAFQHHKELQPRQRCHNNQSSCQQCGALCPGQAELIQHKHDAHGVELFTCDDCNKSFVSKSSLSVHIDRLHLNVKVNHPKGRYTNYTPMLSVGEKRRDYVCEECGKAYMCLAQLKLHQMSRHTGARPYKCEQCSRGFVNATLLRTHIDCIHKRLRKWRCPECPKTFLHQSSVNVHRLIHIGKKTQICTYCGKAFLQSGTLITHVKYVHLKIPPPPRKRNKKKNA